MVEDLEVAKLLADAFKQSFRVLDDTAAIVRERCPETEVDQYLKAVGPVCAEIIFKLMAPLYHRHPELKPPGWDN